MTRGDLFNYTTEVIYRGYGLTYCITYCLRENASQNDTIFAQRFILDICDHLAILKFLWLHNHCSIYIYIYIGLSISSAHYIGIIQYNYTIYMYNEV